MKRGIDAVVNTFKAKNIPDENTEEHQNIEVTLCKSSFIELYHLLYNQDRGLIVEIRKFNESIDTNVLKSLISRLDENIKSFNLNMRTNDIEFNRLKIEEAVIEVFFKEIKDVIKKYNEKELKHTENEFNDAVENVNKIIETDLNDKLNDIKNAEGKVKFYGK